MADVKKVSVGLIDVAERFADMVDAAQGRGARKTGSGAKWLILPAAGAAAYALGTSTSKVARSTRKLIGRAKDRATDLPDADLIGRVKEVTGAADGSSSSSGRSQTTRRSRPRRTGARQTQRRKATAS
jgi:hypothetical protein